MKTILKVLFVSTLTVFFFSQSIAQTSVQSGKDNAATGTVVQGKFVDKDNDGVCDNHEGKGKSSQCANFVDKDGNGVCDNCCTGDKGGKNANCQGHQHGNGGGQGMANGCGHGSCQGKEKAKCCPSQQGSAGTTPSETPDPKK